MLPSSANVDGGSRRRHTQASYRRVHQKSHRRQQEPSSVHCIVGAEELAKATAWLLSVLHNYEKRVSRMLSSLLSVVAIRIIGRQGFVDLLRAAPSTAYFSLRKNCISASESLTHKQNQGQNEQDVQRMLRQFSLRLIQKHQRYSRVCECFSSSALTGFP